MASGPSETSVARVIVDGHRVRLARELREMTQAQLADASGAMSGAALSQIERGHTQPTSGTLRAIADATGMPVQYFQARARTTEPAGFFRGLKSMPARTRKAHLARASAVHDLVAAIEHFVQLPPISVPRLKLSDFESIEEIAHEVRSRWSLPAGPVESVVRELERNGCVVIQQDGFEHAVDAYSIRYPEHAIVVLGKSKGSTARSRFDAAHELAHLVLHDDSVAGTSTAEKQANSFAASFLMPGEEIADELPDTPDWDRLVELKIRWRVSIGALLYRARTLGVMDEHNYTRAMKTMSARGWRKQEPGDRSLGAPEQPVLLNRAAKLAFENGETLESVSEVAALPPWLVEQLLDSGGDSRPVLVL